MKVVEDREMDTEESSTDSEGSVDDVSDYDADAFSMGAIDTQLMSECSTETFQTNVNANGNAEYLLQDAHNLYFSHTPRVLGTGFRFQVGELAYAKWRGELNLVVIHFVSQKLVTTPEDAVEYVSDEEEDEEYDDEEVQPDGSFTVSMKEDVKKDSRDGDDPSYEEVVDQLVTLDEQRNDKEETHGSSNDEANGLKDNNEQLFTDPCTQGLYAEGNAMRPLQLRCDDNEPRNLSAGKKKREEVDDTIKQYLIPIYFVTFPGYKKRCAKTFRFWVKEKDLIKYKAVKQNARRLHKPVIDTTKETEDHANELWVKREIDDIDEYVYKVIYNTYQENLLEGLYKKDDSQVPWCVPSALQQLVAKQQKEVLKRGKENINFYSTEAKKAFSTAPLTERLSAYALVQNFKYVLILMVTLMRRSGDMASGANAKSDVDITATVKDTHNLDVEEINIPSLRMLDQLETAVAANITAQQFQEIYVNNMYWLDVYLKWVDTNFLDNCCYNNQERQFLFMLQNTHKRPLSRIVGLEHFSRLFCFHPMYHQLLRRIYRQGEQYKAYLPITQLLIHYIIFVASDYTHSQNYSISHTEGEFFKLTQ